MTPNTIQIFLLPEVFFSVFIFETVRPVVAYKTSASLRGGALSYQFKCPSELIARRVIFGILTLLVVKTETESLKLW